MCARCGCLSRARSSRARLTTVVESPSLSLGLTGELPATRIHSAKDAGIFELKGVVESLLSLFAVSPDALSTSAAERLTFSADAPAWLEPGRGATALARAASRSRASASWPRASARRASCASRSIWRRSIWRRCTRLPLRRATARELSRFQAVERDFSFTFADAVEWRTIAEAIAALGIPELARLAPVEVFRDAKSSSAPAGHYALLLRCVFQSQERTLREDEWPSGRRRLIAALTRAGRRRFGQLDANPDGFARLCKVFARADSLYTSGMSSGVSVDEFQALEQKVLRAVEIVKREREARAAAEAEVAALREQLAAQAKSAESQVQAVQREKAAAENQIAALNQERETVRQRVEQMLQQMDELL